MSTNNKFDDSEFAPLIEDIQLEYCEVDTNEAKQPSFSWNAPGYKWDVAFTEQKAAAVVKSQASEVSYYSIPTGTYEITQPSTTYSATTTGTWHIEDWKDWGNTIGSSGITYNIITSAPFPAQQKFNELCMNDSTQLNGIKLGDRVETPRGIGIVDEIEDDLFLVLLDDSDGKFLYEFEINEVKKADGQK